MLLSLTLQMCFFSSNDNLNRLLWEMSARQVKQQSPAYKQEKRQNRWYKNINSSSLIFWSEHLACLWSDSSVGSTLKDLTHNLGQQRGTLTSSWRHQKEQRQVKKQKNSLFICVRANRWVWPFGKTDNGCSHRVLRSVDEAIHRRVGEKALSTRWAGKSQATLSWAPADKECSGAGRAVNTDFKWEVYYPQCQPHRNPTVLLITWPQVEAQWSCGIYDLIFFCPLQKANLLIRI